MNESRAIRLCIKHKDPAGFEFLGKNIAEGLTFTHMLYWVIRRTQLMPARSLLPRAFAGMWDCRHFGE